jgi:hypothetical protein
MLMMHFINADGIVSRPLAVVQALAKRKSSVVKCGPDWQKAAPSISVYSVSSVVKDLS